MRSVTRVTVGGADEESSVFDCDDVLAVLTSGVDVLVVSGVSDEDSAGAFVFDGCESFFFVVDGALSDSSSSFDDCGACCCCCCFVELTGA